MIVPTMRPASSSDMQTIPVAAPARRKASVLMMLLALTALVPFVVELLVSRSGLLSAGAAMRWQAPLLYLHVGADLVIGLSYLGIAAGILYFARRVRGSVPFLWLFTSFGIFIISCGLAHLMQLVTYWVPLYWVAGGLKYVAAATSLGTAIALPTLVPRAFSFITSASVSEDRRNQLVAQNEALMREARDRELAEVMNRAHLTRLRAIIDTLPMGALVADEDGTILHANRRVCQLFGLRMTPASLTGQQMEKWFAQVRTRMADKVEYDRTLRASLATQESIIDTELQLDDGTVIACDVIPVIVDDMPQGRLFLYRDVTKERRVDRAKSEFMSLASHQLRTPLTAIRWGVRRAEKMLGKNHPEVASLLDETHGAAKRMSHTIDTMLAISRLESGQIRLEVTEVKIGALLHGLRHECREAYETKQQSFDMTCETHMVLSTDPHILEEVLRNLFTNAIKYTPERGHIAVKCMRESHGVRIEVRDSGYGIPLTQQERVFRKFFRGDNIVSMDTEGSGLGLYMVSLLMRLLQGDIGFTSIEGRGTVFTLFLPSIGKA